MTSFFDKLNLRPVERRIVMIVATMLFLVANWIFIYPYFGQVGKEREKLDQTQKALDKAKEEGARLPQHRKRLEALQGQGTVVLAEEQGLDLQKTVYDLANRSGVALQEIRMPSSSNASTNDFFEEKVLTIRIANATKENLNNFLVNVTGTESMLRIRSLEISPNPTMQGLDASIEIVASYQRNLTKSRASAPATTASTQRK